LATNGSLPLLVVVCGLPRAGKSTYARAAAHFLRAGIVSSDAWRRAVHGREFWSDSEALVWGMVEAAVRAGFGGGHETVILDATNNTRARRQRWVSRHWETRYKVIDTSRTVCLERARGGSEGLRAAISRMAQEWEPLGSDESEYEEPEGLASKVAASVAAGSRGCEIG
jgi:predicted kinase